jgi:hypothetical protein
MCRNHAPDHTEGQAAMPSIRHPKICDCGSLFGPPSEELHGARIRPFEVLPDGAAVWQAAVTSHERHREVARAIRANNERGSGHALTDKHADRL